MSKFFYRGRPDVMTNYGKNGYKPNPNVKLGTAGRPLVLTVANEQRSAEVQALADLHNLVANITIDAKADENIAELEVALNKPSTQRFEKTPERNDPCSCGSGKKYKKCCA
ncbi:SEC-C domain-containing protein [Colwellia sp. D2M02]|uniref:PBPRA1643 family SWIM/SEC-C metal-binding motif protein n=1 Tax=Colwellia sp. D2M02 TaxID=2841562 RepID=UPI001C08D69E|nr:PBPRA1643 family SWIM/SEC-C metal-binding motif protein [Colwellia sp. D2M02]MBU2893406.1 SEC-C domain-containing protein [Colwellia sp. D2M02]